MSAITDIQHGDFKWSDNKTRSTRNCVNYLRVNERRGGRNALRGFCIFGIQHMNFEMFISSSFCQKCESYMFCPEKSKIQNMENEVSKKFWDYRDKNEDDIIKSLESGKKRPMSAFVLSQKIVSDNFLRENVEELIELHKHYDMEFKEYQQIMDKVKRFIFNSTSILKHKKR